MALTCPCFDFIILNEGTVKISIKLNIKCDVTARKKWMAVWLVRETTSTVDVVET